MRRLVNEVVWVRRRGWSSGESAFRSPEAGRAYPSWRVVVGLSVLFVGAGIGPLKAAPLLQLKAEALVTGQGVFLPDLVTAQDSVALPHVQVASAPPFGQARVLTRAQAIPLLRRVLPEAVATNLGGAPRITLARRSRKLEQAELQARLTALLQKQKVGERGELQLIFRRPWAPVAIPDEDYELEIVDLPRSGLSANFIVRFCLRTAAERLGPWQAVLEAKVWRDIWVARTALRRGQRLADADIVRERRDVLRVRGDLFEPTQNLQQLELAMPVPAGAPLTARAVRLRPVVRRGQVAEARLVQGALSISLKVEVLENGAPGQVVRVRNLRSRREFRGVVKDEQTIMVSL